MASAGLSHAIAQRCVRHPWRVLACWTLLVVAGLLVFFQGHDQLRADVTLFNRPPSVQASNLIRERLAGAPITTSILCAGDGPAASRTGGEPTGAPVEFSAVAAAVRTCLDSGQAAKAGNVGLPATDSPAGARLLTELDLLETPKETAIEFLEAFETLAAGHQSGEPEGNPLKSQLDERVIGAARSDLHRADRFGVLVAAVVLVLLTRALVAPVISMLLSLAAIAAALGLTLLLSRAMPLSLYVVNIVVMFGLAVGIDYSLVFLHRYREERKTATDVETAIARTAETAGRTVLLAGSAAVLSLSGLLFIPISIFRGLALGAIAVMVMGLAAALTLLPACLRLIGDRLDWPRTPPLRRGECEAPPSVGLWGRFSRQVMARPALAMLVAFGVLAPLIVQASALQPGLSLPKLAAESEPEQPAPPTWEVRSIEAASRLFGVVEIVVDADRSDDLDGRIEELAASIGQNGSFSPVIVVQWNASNDLAVMSALLAGPPDGQAAIDAVRQLQHDLIPATFADRETSVVVGGAPSSRSDVLRAIEQWQWRVVGLVLLMSFSLLLIAFRSIAVPIKATLMNLLSTTAALGAVVLVFQKGIGASLLGFEQTSSVEAWVPLLLFCVLVGLSTDYHLFLLGRVREYYVRSGDNRSAVAAGVESTGSIITGAALVMVTVFASFASGALVSLQQLGFGLAVAVLIDATIIRSVLAPAMMALLGRWNWYLPRCLNWLPRIGLATPPHAPSPAIGTIQQLG